ncbi:roadblock/LC7 domain-containing protein [Methanobacterium aggregans]|uniref:roadblock/LC7 domain-containing protein n=1 Tax=Methanobacterium aggregans TaxID=1615586 RepID=UPI001AE8B2F4|nr:roadblock/LC7 domain-containing protein [Methanobacterium aggregans]MBP2046616.1 putative regulator of Ras-like GTPase activity (Roadblock/LC7/MglB family) [Methanobacterium aggregans]
MKDPEMQNQLERSVNNLNKVEGVDGSLIIDSNGVILYHKLFSSSDISLFGSMASVITSSSRRLLNSADQGEIERVLVESKNGKALFFHLEKVNLIVLMKISANIGMVMVSAKRAVKGLNEILKDFETSESEIPVETPEKLMEERVETSQPDTPAMEGIDVKPEIGSETLVAEASKQEEVLGAVVSEKTEEIHMEDLSLGKSLEKDLEEDLKEDLTSKELLKLEEKVEVPEEFVESLKEVVDGGDSEQDLDVDTRENSEEIVEVKSSIPIIKPPITFPKLPDNVNVPEDPQERADLIMDIYRSIFLAMAIGAGKIMGLAPAKGLTKKFLPVEEYPKLLEGVEVKNNSTIDFDKIKENAEKIPINERQETFINDFTGIITVITENYGKVMGYGAFRGMVRREFQVITTSYGGAMKELGITENIHPELSSLLE